VHDGKVSLQWDLGSGGTKLDFTGVDITNNRWTRINATRFGSRSTLSVQQLDSGSGPLPAVTGTSPGSSRVLDIDRNTVLHIGGLGPDTQGCLGEASLNEKNIGLWSYERQDGQCGGCFSSPQAEETSFHFDGSGFSLVQKSLRATSTSVVLQFKTLSPAGLLLYLSSNNTRDFLSMELVKGHVHLTFDLGSGALILTSKRVYNTGEWFKVTLQRNRRKANQSSEKEVLEAESPGTASDLNRSDLDPIYIGGLPASRPIRSYVGCIKNVEIARSNFDLLRDAYGVRKGCVLEVRRPVLCFLRLCPTSLSHLSVSSPLCLLTCLTSLSLRSLSLQVDEEKVKSVSLFPGGFSRLSPASFFIGGLPAAVGLHLPIRLQGLSATFRGCIQHVCASQQENHFLPSAAHFGSSRNSHMTFSINPGAVLRLSVRSWAEDGLILVLSDSKQMDFVAVGLRRGRVLLSVDLGKGPSSVTSSVPVNDGQWHAVRGGDRRTASLSVDGSSPDVASVRGNQLDVDGRLYLGGLPAAVSGRRINVSSSLPGCIRSVSLNGAMLDLSAPASMHDVTSCFAKDQTGSYFNGSGYAELMHHGYKVGSDLTVSLEFRTSQSDGVFLGISSAKVDAIGLELVDGQAVFNVNNGAGRVSVRSAAGLLCDGRWHHLLARKTKHSLSLLVDGRSYSTHNPYPQSTSAETNNPVYVGGFPGET
uniref:Laminin G domain-containing protein n=1 Tax=Salarias fasciatus TaxID=181472 RepID=A0A672HAN2_SALFA